MDDIEELKRRKLEELRARQSDAVDNQIREEAEAQQQLNMIEAFVKQKLTKEAIQRYGNLKAADPEKAAQLVVLLAQAIHTSNISNIGDDELKSLLARMQPKKRDFKITRK